MKTPNRNSEVLTSFVAYCEAHPQERFWQALRNWSQYGFIFVSRCDCESHRRSNPDGYGLLDTFMWEDRDG